MNEPLTHKPKKFGNSRGSLVLPGVFFMVALVTAAGWFAMLASSRTQSRLIQEINHDLLSRSIFESVAMRVISDYRPTVDATFGDLRALFPGAATTFTRTYGKQEFAREFSPSYVSILVPPPGGFAPGAVPVVAPETDPVVTLTKTTDNCRYRVTITYSACEKILGSRLPLSGTGLGVPWNPPCGASDQFGVSRTYFLQLKSPAFKDGAPKACT